MLLVKVVALSRVEDRRLWAAAPGFPGTRGTVTHRSLLRVLEAVSLKLLVSLELPFMSLMYQRSAFVALESHSLLPHVHITRRFACFSWKGCALKKQEESNRSTLFPNDFVSLGFFWLSSRVLLWKILPVLFL